MHKITVTVTQRDKTKIKRLLTSGTYSTQSEVMRAGLRKLRTPK